MALMTSEEYLQSLGKMKPTVYVDGERVENFVDHPLIRPAINITAKMYAMAQDPDYEGVLNTTSHLTGRKISRFNHIYQSTEDLQRALSMLRVTNQAVGACNMRCLTKELINPLYDTTFEIDRECGTDYHRRFKDYLIFLQDNDRMASAGVTDAKGDRRLRPSKQFDPDLYLRMVDKNEKGIIVRGAKMHQTGALTAHYLNVVPTTIMDEDEKDYAVAFATPSDAPGLIHVFGRHALDERRYTGADLGNIKYDMHETMIIFNDLFVPWERVFMCGEYRFTGSLVENFIANHRYSYGGCRPGTFDVLIGAAKLIAEYNGIDRASHVREKLTQMSFLNETMWACAVAAAVQGVKKPSGWYQPDKLLANVTKLHVTSIPHELGKLAIDLAGGIVATLPSEKNLRNPEIGPLVRKYLRTKAELPVEDRMRIIRLIEFLVQGVTIPADYFGGGGPATQKMIIERETNFEYKKRLAKIIAGITEEDSENKAGKMMIDGVVAGCCDAYGTESCPLTQRS